MGGWALFAGIALAAALALWLLRFPLSLKLFALAAIMLGAAGYAWQGNPARAGQPVTVKPATFEIDDETIALRNAMFGRYGMAAGYLTPSDALMRYGSPDAAARMVQGGINHDPTSVVLWTQLGIITATRDDAVSPAALFAFERAIRLAPGDPAPWFFLGLMRVRGGEFSPGRVAWVRALALTPANSPFHKEIAARLGLLDWFLKNSPPAR